MMTKEQFVQEIEAHTGVMYRVAFTILRNDEDCKDAMSDATLKAWEKRNSLRDITRFRAWMIRIVTNTSYFSDEGENIYTIYPIWMCECDYTESAKEELKKSEQIPDERKQYYYKQLVINAQTGQIEPYLIEKQELAYCPRVITWESLK